MRLIRLASDLLTIAIISAFSINAHSQERTSSIEIRGNAGVVSDYVFRGISQSDESVVAQGGLDVVLPKGFYAGAWASGVDTPWGGIYNQQAGPEDFEYDVYAGWQWGHESGKFRLDTGVIQYAFSDDPDDLTWSEYYLGATFFKRLRVKASLQVDGLDFGDYYEASYRQPLANSFDATAHVGYFDVAERSVRDIDQYADYSVGVGRPYKGFRFDLTYHRTDRDGRARYLDVADDRLVLSIKRDFELFPNFRAFDIGN
ncbi:MAG: hypothetical protein ACI9WC_001374 [Arenicella sp.]|jgi:uncharacterized protein (TIGR02001 family)